MTKEVDYDETQQLVKCVDLDHDFPFEPKTETVSLTVHKSHMDLLRWMETQTEGDHLQATKFLEAAIYDAVLNLAMPMQGNPDHHFFHRQADIKTMLADINNNDLG